MKTGTKLVRTAVLFLLIATGVCGLGYWWLTGSHRAKCSLQLSNYNQCVASCGMDSYAEDAWKDPKKTEELVWKLFRMRIPECPSGGQYSLVYNRGAHAWLPKLVCSHEDSRGHLCRGIEHDEDQASIKESESGRGDGIAPVTPPTPPDMRVRIRRFQSDDGDRP